MSLFSKPDRRNFTPGESGDRQYFQSLLRYTFWLVFTFAFIFGISFVWFLRENTSYQMIDLRGRDVIDAVKWLQERSLKPFISEKIDPDFPGYHVIEQSPAPGTTVKENRTVSLVVSYGRDTLVMPSYRGSNYTSAYQALLSYLSGYENIPRVTKIEKYSDLPEGQVVDHYPRFDQPINFQERFIFVVSRGIATNKIIAANYLNRDFLEIEEMLLSYGVRVSVDYVTSLNKSLAGKIVEQNIKPGQRILPGMIIRFKVGFYDPERVQSQGSTKIEVLRLYRFQVPAKSSLNEFTRNLDSDQKVYIAPTNTRNNVSKLRSVLIEVTDQVGKRILFNDYLDAGESMQLPYRTLGRGSLRVLIDGEVFETLSFN